MSFLGLCSGDPVVDTLREVFGANIVRVPEERIKPLVVLGSHGKRTSFRGRTIGLLLKGTPSVDIPVSESTMSAVSGKRSNSVDIKFGLSVLSSVLEGFNLPATGIEEKFQGATEVSFSFSDVARQFIDKGELGLALKGCALDRLQPAAAIFFGEDPWDCLLIDSTIASSDFNIEVHKASSNDFKLDVGAIQAIVDKAGVGVKVSATSKSSVTFKGPKRLSFAFSCVRLFVNEGGRIQLLEEDSLKRQLQAAGGATMVEQIVPPRVLITQEPAMIDVED
jgi:hypothetical protein